MSDFEKNMLGAILCQSELWSACNDLLPEWLSDPNRRIFGAMKDLADRHDPVNVLSLVTELTATKQLHVVGGAGYLNTLTDGAVATPSHVAYCKRQIVKS